MPILGQKIKVLIVDDSTMVRKILSEAISSESDMEVVGTAPDPFIARDKIAALKPDVLTLDIEMPRMDGITFLKRLMHLTPIPTIIISSLGQASSTAAIEALRLGAVEVLPKPAGPYSVGDLRYSLAAKIRAAAGSKPRAASDAARIPAPSPDVPSIALSTASAATGLPVPSRIDPRMVIAIGASTGGTVAIQEVLTRLPHDMPPIIITQHIPAGFSKAFASRLDKLCALDVREAVDGDVLQRGVALIAPGDFHMVLRRCPAGYAVELQQGPQVCYQRPSADVMFFSLARLAAASSIGVLLTGMGADGARGLLALNQAGARTIAQDEASCVVFGMPKEAIRLGAVDAVAALAEIPGLLTKAASGSAKAKRPPSQTVEADSAIEILQG